ncbi:MAG: cytochrome c3 family protein, partial [Elusimicrobia bacterium]|nr:cytochrome c3 family protein [Elusimicrobiota bacterium]
MKNLILSAVILLTGAASAGALSVINSKHDLSVGSATTGPKSTTEQQTCMFCHTVHRPAQRSQLWNRADSAVQFTFYSSNYLNNYLGQATPTMTDLKASKTKLCLSCHDGVTALGALYNIAPNTLQMTGTLGASSVIGTDLSNDHPVLYDVKPGAGPPTQPGTDSEIQLPPAGDAVKVYGTTNRVECTSCHEPHDNTFGKFLVKSNANAALCTSCHQKTGYASSAHGTSNAAYTGADGAATTVGEYSCRNCHMSHGASSAQAYILRGAEENTCYNCHGSPSLPGAKNIKNQYAKASKHPTETVSGVHKNPE